MSIDVDNQLEGRSWLECFGFQKKAPAKVVREEKDFDLNNFFMNFPGGFYREDFMLAVHEEGETYKEFFERRAENEGREKNLTGYSVLKLHQTPEEFFHTIDRAVAKAGLDWDGVRLLNIAVSESAEHRKILLEHLNTMIRPVYYVLRAWGYSPKDLLE